jgi:hypothetical protein
MATIVRCCGVPADLGVMPWSQAIEPATCRYRQGGRLAGTRRTEQRQELAGLDVQVQPVHRGRGGTGVALDDAVELDQGHGCRSRRMCRVRA